MSCGIVDAENVRSIPIRELVPWQDTREVRIVPKRHDDHLYFTILYEPPGMNIPPVIHSYWKNATAARSFLKVNPGKGAS